MRFRPLSFAVLLLAGVLARPSRGGSVDQASGTYHDEVPIDVPQFHAVSPSLRLAYGSSTPAGQLGVGWSLGGLSYLERVSSPGRGAPRYDASDHWLLDGTELIPCSEVTAASSTSCASGGTHTTRVETWTKIVGDWTGFTVWLKDGTRSEFRLAQKTLGGDAFRYYLSQVVDTHGNAVSYGYTTLYQGSTTTQCRNKTGTECWPQCSNAGDINACMAQCTAQQVCEQVTDPSAGPVEETYLTAITYNRVTIAFSYEARPDPVVYARGRNELGKITRRLRTIDVTVLDGSGVTRRRNAYDLGYTLSGATRRSLLASVTPYGSDATVTNGVITGGSRRPPMTFQYRGGANEGGDFLAETWTTSSGPWGDAQYRYVGDFNGDGRTDLATRGPGYEQHVKLATASSTFTDTLFAASLPGFGAGDWAWVGDYNGDGKSDYFTRSGSSMDWHESTGSSFVSHGLSASEGSSQWAASSDVFIGDFTGDGKDDVLSHVGSQLQVISVTGPATFYRSTWSSEASSFGPRSKSWAADFNGDGRTDLATVVSGQVIVFRSLGNRFVRESWSYAAGFTDKAWLNWVGDFNGDGKADLAAPEGTSVQVYLSNGWSFAKQPWLSLPSGWPSAGDYRHWAMDADGDGKTDIVAFDGQLEVYRSLGVSLAAADIWGGTGDWMGDPDKIFPGDFNGDGRGDIAVASGSTIGIKRSVLYAGATPLVGAVDMISSLNNGLGGRFTFQFVSSSQTSGATGGMVPFQLIQAVTLDDGRGTSGTTTYVYEGGHFSRAERRFVGFRTVSEYKPRVGTTWQPLTRTSYEVTAADGLARPIRVERLGDQGKVYEKTETTYAHSTTLPWRTLEVTTASTVADASGASRTSTVSRSYDAFDGTTWKAGFGNLVVEVHRGGADVSGRARTIQYFYYPNATAFITGKPAASNVRDGATTSGTLLAQTLFYYDGASTWQAAPVRGDLTREAAWLDRIWSGGSIAAANAYVITSRSYDAWGNVTSVTLPATAAAPGGTVTSTAYDGLFHLYPLTITNGKGQATVNTWDVVRGLILGRTAGGLTTTYGYDAFGREVQATYPTGLVASKSTVGDGNPNGGYRQASAPGPAGGTLWTREYTDGLGRVWRRMSSGPTAGAETCVDLAYSASGLEIGSTQPFLCSDTVKRWTTTTYDGLDRPIAMTAPDGKTVTTSYALGKVTVTDQGGHQVIREVDSLGHLSRQTEISGTTQLVTTYAYDALGHKNRATDPAGLVSTWITDSLGRVLQETTPDRGTIKNEFDATGNPIATTSALGERTTFTYDVLGRVLSKTTRTGTAGARTTTSTYDEARAGFFNQGRLTTLRDPDGDVTTYDSGRSGQVEKRVRTIGGLTYVQSWVYDAGGRLRYATFPDGDTLGTAATPLGYDAAGRLSSIPGYLTAVSYDQLDRATRLVFANGTETNLAYDAARTWLTRTTTKLSASGAILHDLAYAYDGEGHVTAVTSAAAHAGETWTYAYDALHRLTAATSTTGGAGSETFTYDGIGNLRSRSTLGSYTVSGHRVTRVDRAAGSWIDFSYDAAGRMTSRKSYLGSALQGTTTYTWNGDGLLEATGNAVFTYDGNGNRKKQSVGGVVTVFLGDDYEISGGVVTKHISLGGLKIARKTGGTRVWLHSDRQGSVQLETSATGAALQRYAYGPYGKAVSTAVPTARAGYTGQRLDPTGLMYLHDRYYDPALGRFISADPTVPSNRLVGLNGYAYAGNNPVSFTDIDGRGWFEWVMLAASVAVAVFQPELAPLLFAINTSVNFMRTAEEDGSMLRFLAVTAIEAVGGHFAGQAASKGLSYAIDFGTGFVGSLVQGRSVGQAFQSAAIGTAISVGTDALAEAVNAQSGHGAPRASSGETGGDLLACTTCPGGTATVNVEILDAPGGDPVEGDVKVPVALGYDLGNAVVYVHYKLQGGKLVDARVEQVLLEGASGVTSYSGQNVKASLMGPSDLSIHFEGDVGLMLSNSIGVGGAYSFFGVSFAKSMTSSPIIAIDGWVGLSEHGQVLYTSGWSRGVQTFKPQLPAPKLPDFGDYFKNWYPLRN